MIFHSSRLLRWLGIGLSSIALSFLTAQPVLAQSILRDTESEAVLREMVRPIVMAAGLDPRNVDIAIVNDPEINAFVAGGQVVFINSGLLVEADNANQVQGVVAHELGHMAGGHVLRSGKAITKAYGIMLLSVIAELMAASAAGGANRACYGCGGYDVGGANGNGVTGGDTYDPGTLSFLAFSRDQEATADAAGARFLDSAHISGRGSIEFFKKLQNLENRFSVKHNEQASFNQSHPLTPDRIAYLTDQYPKSKAWNTKTDPALEAKFQRVKAKLKGFVNDPTSVIRDYPESDQSIPAHYARAYAYHRGSYMDKAVSEADAMLAKNPHDPYFLELKGQILLESGKAQLALAPLREASQTTAAQPLIAALFGHALFETENQANYPEALRVLKAAVVRDRDNPLAWLTLGEIYDRQGDVAHAALCTAESALMARNWPQARRNAVIAGHGLPLGSADAIRAQDIEMVAQSQIDKTKKHKH